MLIKPLVGNLLGLLSVYSGYFLDVFLKVNLIYPVFKSEVFLLNIFGRLCYSKVFCHHN